MAHDSNLRPDDIVLLPGDLDDSLLYQLGVADVPEAAAQDAGPADLASTGTDDSALADDSEADLVADLGGDLAAPESISVDSLDLSYIQVAASAWFGTSTMPGDAGLAVEVTIDAGYETSGWSGSACACPLCSGGFLGGSGASGGGVGVPGPAGTLATLATYLNERNTGSGGNDFWDDFWGGGSDVSTPFFNLTGSGNNAKNGVITYNISGNNFDANGIGAGSNGSTAASRIDLIRHALNVYEDILGINFVETTAANSDLNFGDWDSNRAYANFNRAADGAISNAWINIGTNWSGGNGIGDYYFHTALHEIGHTLGLGHQGLYNAGAGNPTYNDSTWANDTIQFTMMSYWAQANYTPPGQSTPSGAFLGSVNVIGPQSVDWLALDRIYGAQGYGIANGTTTSNTTWGFNSTWSDWTPTNSGPLFGYSNTAYASLDTLLDTNTVCIVDGGGTDTLDLSGFSNNTKIDIRTSSSSSTAPTFSDVAGLIGNLSLAVGTVIENVVGGAGNETIYGNQVANNLQGGGGNDWIDAGSGGVDSLYGGSGNDTLYPGTSGPSAGEIFDGGSGTDLLDFGSYNNHYVVNLSTGVFDLIVGGFLASVSGIENVTAGNGNDSLVGDGANNVLSGGDGNDTINAGGGVDIQYGGAGDDLFIIQNGWGDGPGAAIYGGSGIDTFDVSGASLATSDINLAAGTFTYTPGGSGTISLSGIENVSGSVGADSITGDGNANALYGNAGNDTLWGGLGSDALYGGDGDDELQYNAGLFTEGSDTLNGGAGIDTLMTNVTWTSGVLFDLAAGQASFNGSFSGQVLQGIENVSVGGSAAVTGDFGDNVIIGLSASGNNYFIGGGGADTIEGGGGNDTIEGGFVTDSISGGDGDDLFIVRNGEFYDSVDGGAGTDTLDHSLSSYGGTTFDFDAGVITGPGINGASATLLGIEVYYDGTGGNTIVSSGSGHTYYGGDGNDTMRATSGAETMYGGNGTDDLDLSIGNFVYTFDMTTGLATQYSGELFLGFENVTMGSANDTVTGTSGSNVIDGGGGNDSLDGLGGDDTIYGGTGNDTIRGGTSTDMVDGGDGDDLVIVAGGDGLDDANGGAGVDTLDYTTAFGTSIIFDMATGSFNFDGFLRTATLFENFFSAATTDIVHATNADNIVNLSLGNDSAFGYGGNDALRGQGGNDYLELGDGDDTGTGGSGADTVYGGAGNDSVSGQAGIDYLYGDIGNDTLNGANGADVLSGGAGQDSMIGGKGADYLDGGLGADTMIGGNGDDIYIVDDAGDVVVEGNAGASGAADLVNALISVSLAALSANVENLTLMGASNIDGAGNALGNIITGNSGLNLLDGGDGNDVVYGGDGGDTVLGGGDNDTLYGDNGADSLDGGNGNDVASGGSGDDTVKGGSGNDTLYGGDDLDNLQGGGGNDVLYGGNGRDTLNGGLGNDTLDGNGGNDVFVFADGFGVDVINGYVTAGNAEVIDLAAVTAIVDYADLVSNHLTEVAGSAVITVGVNSITIFGVALASLTSNDFLF